MEFPKKVEVVETFDNGEFVTTTSLIVDSFQLQEFIKKYQFEQNDSFYTRQFIGGRTLKGTKPNFSKGRGLYFKTGSKGKNSWCYIVDLKELMLWAEIQYPDWGGT
jgi:hypothetical protein